MDSAKTREAMVALQRAIELETRGYDFYQKAADRITNRRGTEMFRSLANDEILHQGILQRQLEALSEGEGWLLPEGIPDASGDLPIALLPEGEEAFRKAIRPDDTDLDALVFALQFENESYQLYHELAQATDDPLGKGMYESLAWIERDHFNLVMLNYEHLSATGSWADR